MLIITETVYSFRWDWNAWPIKHLNNKGNRDETAWFYQIEVINKLKQKFHKMISADFLLLEQGKASPYIPVYILGAAV